MYPIVYNVYVIMNMKLLTAKGGQYKSTYIDIQIPNLQSVCLILLVLYFNYALFCDARVKFECRSKDLSICGMMV